MRAWLAPAGLTLLPLVFWPGLAQPFSTPKVILMALLAAIVWAMPAARPWRTLPPLFRWAALAAIASVGLAGAAAPLPALFPMLIGLLAPALAIAAVRQDASGGSIVAGQAIGASCCAVIALLQWIGTDPIAWLGWLPPIDGASVRMRVYGTLGNPNFVGVLMAMSLPLTAAVHRRAGQPAVQRLWEIALALQAAALMATGSRGAVFGLATATTVYALLRWSRRVRLSLAALLAFAVLAVSISPARPIDTTAAGRVYLWRIAAPHAVQAPLTGLGPGAVTLRFPEWQREAARQGIRDPRFAGLTDHVHNDYLEALIERGLPGLLALVLPMAALGLAAARVPRPADPLLAGAVAAVAAGSACALIDFPFARPIELVWWWTAFGVATSAIATASHDTGPVTFP